MRSRRSPLREQAGPPEQKWALCRPRRSRVCASTRQRTLTTLAIPLVLTTLGGQAGAVTLRVPQSYPTIQAGINAALVGDRVLVAPGTYREHIVLRSGVSVEGDGTVASPVRIVGSGTTTVVTFDAVYDAALRGFSLSGVGAQEEDALIAITNSSPILENLILEDSQSTGIRIGGESYPDGTDLHIKGLTEGIRILEGAGASISGLAIEDVGGTAISIGQGSFPELHDVRIERADLGLESLSGSAPVLTEFWILDSFTHGIVLDGASALIRDGQIIGSGQIGIHSLNLAQPNLQRLRIDSNDEGVVVESGSPIIAFCQLALNTRAAIVLKSQSYPAILHNLLQDNGTGIELSGSSVGDASPHIFNNTIVASSDYGIHCVDNAFPAIDNNIVTYHKKFGILCEGSSRPTLAYNLFYGNGGVTDGSYDYGGRCEAASTDISDDPLFVAFSDDGDPYNDDLHLQDESPAVNAGNPQSAYNDNDGTRNDMGAYGGPDFPAFIDMDGDSFTADQGDCNDADATVHPGAQELEDGIDNDCDGSVDEDPGTWTPGPDPSSSGGTETPGGGTPPDGDGSPGPDGSGTPGIEYAEGCDCRQGLPAHPFRPALFWMVGVAILGMRRKRSSASSTPPQHPA